MSIVIIFVPRQVLKWSIVFSADTVFLAANYFSYVEQKTSKTELHSATQLIPFS